MTTDKNTQARETYKKRQDKLNTFNGNKKCLTCNEEKDASLFRSDTKCKSCFNAYMRRWNSDNRDNVRQRNREYKIRCSDNYQNSKLKHLFGITLDQYMQMLVDQDFVCKICSRPERAKLHGKIKNLAVDHCHDTGKVRGLLCAQCNTVLGTVEDNIERLYSMIQYLKKSREQ